MLPHWDTVIQPFLSALDAGPLIEIGAARGDTTAKLAEFAVERGLTLHSVDPTPRFDVATYEKRFNGNFCFRQERSHDALQHIDPAAAVLIDGDHNWYTVHGELTLLESMAAAADHHFPLVIVHDVEWPYARRDMYYDPEAIPEEGRNPWARLGIRWGERLLDEAGGGLNPQLANAIEEGGPRNGVLTAIEDFIEKCQAPLELRIVRGDFGVGILVSHDLLASSPPVRLQWERLCSPEFLEAEAERLSRAAVVQAAARLEAAREVECLERELRSSSS